MTKNIALFAMLASVTVLGGCFNSNTTDVTPTDDTMTTDTATTDMNADTTMDATMPADETTTDATVTTDTAATDEATVNAVVNEVEQAAADATGTAPANQ